MQALRVERKGLERGRELAHVGVNVDREIVGAKYDRKNGVECCPNCKTVGPIVRSTRPWEGAIRVRHHYCKFCGHSFKSTEEE